MTIVRLDNIVAGMVLNSDVCDRRGRVLLPADTELTDKHLRIFNTWGVVEADIVGSEKDDDAPVPFASDIDPATLAEAEAAIDRLLIHCDRDLAVIKELKHACILRKIAHAS